jgi:hypothetical protein
VNQEDVMTIRKLLLAAALGVTALGCNAAHAQDRTYSSGAQQQDRSRDNNRGSGRSDREGLRHAQDQQGRGYNAPDSYRQRGGGHGAGRYDRAARGHHGSHCRVHWRHHHRVRACR